MIDQKSNDALSAVRTKFPTMPDVRSLSDEQKAWLQMKIQSIADGAKPSELAVQLGKIHGRLVHAMEDVSDGELQKMVSFVFENMDEIEKLL